MDVAKRVDDATATTKEALTKMQRFVTAGLPDATVNALMDAAKGIDNAIARAEQIIKQANTMAHKLPDVAVNALMDAAKLVDDATTKANSAFRQAREFITQGLPDKAMNVLMDAAKSVDDATARVKKFGVDIKAFVTEDLPDATVNALMDAAKALDDSIAAVKDAIPNAVKYIRDDIARARIERPVREALAKVGDDVERVNKAFKTGDSDALKSAVADARNDMASAEALVSSPDAVALLEQARQTLGDVVSLSVIPFEGVRPELMARLAELQNKWASAVEAERGAEQKMVDTAGRYADQASTVAKLDPDTASRMKELPSWLKYATKDMVNRVMNPRTVDVITAERNQARLEVDKAVKEYSNNPEMWREPVQQLLDRERELMLSQSGKWETDLQTVVRTQQALKDLDALMTKAVSLEAKQAIQDLMTRIRERQAESAIIVNNMISDMENYWLDPNKSIIRKSTQELDVVLKQLAEAKDVLKPEGTLTIQELRDLQKLKMNQQNLETTIQTAKDLESQPLSDATKDIIKKERIDAENKQYGLNIMKDIEKSDAINEALKKLDTSKGISKSDWDNFASDAVWQGEKEAFRTMSEVDRLALEKAQERLQGLIDKGLQGFEDQNLLKRLEPEGRQANKAEEIAKQSEKTARDADDAYRAKEWGDSADDILKRAQMEQKVADLLERARIDRSNADFLTKDYKGGLETVYEKLADKFFDGDRNALEEYLRGEGSVGETLESGGLDQQQLKDKLDALMKDPEKLIDDMKTKARTELDDALDEIDKLLKRPDNAPSEGLADTLKDVDEFLKKGKESPGAPEQGIPTMITHQMEARLKALGYTDAEIASMTPQDAWDKINTGEETAGKTSEQERPPERGGGDHGERGTRTAVKEETETKTRAETEAEKILEEKQAAAKPEEAIEKETKGAVEVDKEPKPTEAKPSMAVPFRLPEKATSSYSPETEGTVTEAVSPYVKIGLLPTEGAMPTPSPSPSPSPTPTPTPSPSPSPSPTPTPTPSPSPSPSPTPTPTPSPSPSPIPDSYSDAFSLAIPIPDSYSDAFSLAIPIPDSYSDAFSLAIPDPDSYSDASIATSAYCPDRDARRMEENGSTGSHNNLEAGSQVGCDSPALSG